MNSCVSHEDSPYEGCHQDVHDVNEQRVEAQNAKKAEDIPGLETEGEGEHGKAADDRDEEEFNGPHLTIKVQIVQLSQDEEGNGSQERERFGEEALRALVKEKTGNGVSQREKNIKLHPVGLHTIPIDIWGEKVEAQAQELLRPLRGF